MRPYYSACFLTLVLCGPASAAGRDKPYFSVACAADKSCAAEPGGFSVPKRPGVKRVFLIGGQASLPNPAALKTSLPGVEIINCALNPAQDEGKVLAEALAYQPDLAVVLGAGPAGEPAAPGGYYQRSKQAVSRLFGRFRAARRTAEAGSPAERAGRLRALAGLARGRGNVPLLFCTLPVNLSGQPPASYPLPQGEAYTAGSLRLWQDPAAAAGFFAKALEQEPGNPLVEFSLGKALEAGKLFAEARAHYSRALDLDAWQERPSPALNAAIRKAAAASGTGLCDLETAFSRVSASGLPGLDQFSYGARRRPAYDSLAWGEIAGAARAAGLDWFVYKAPAAPPAALTDKDLRETLAAAAAELSAYPAGGPSVLSEPAVAAFGFVEARRKGLAGRFIEAGADLGGAAKGLLQAHLAEALRRRGDGPGALPHAALALASEPSNPRFRLLKDLCLLGAGRKKEARNGLEKLFSEPAARGQAIADARAYGLLAPGSPEPAVPSDKELAASKKLADEAVGGLGKGEYAGSRRQLEGALKVNPFNAEALMSLCSLKYAAGELQDALAACDGVPGATAARYPDSGRVLTADSLRLKAMIYFKLRRPQAAAAALKAAITGAPADWGNLDAARAELRGAEGR